MIETVALILGIALVTAPAVAVVAWLATAARIRAVEKRRVDAATAVRDRVLVSMLNGDAMTGVLWERADRFTVLRGVEIMTPGQKYTRPIDGDVIIDREQISFVQRAV